jgi:hypothetical protein
VLFSICFRKWEIDAFSFVDACIKFSIDELSVSLWPILLLNRISTSFLISQDDKDQKLHSVCMIIEYNFDKTELKTPHCIETIRDACLIWRIIPFSAKSISSLTRKRKYLYQNLTHQMVEQYTYMVDEEQLVSSNRKKQSIC